MDFTPAESQQAVAGLAAEVLAGEVLAGADPWKELAGPACCPSAPAPSACSTRPSCSPRSAAAPPPSKLTPPS